MPSERSNSSGSYRSVTHLSADLALVLKVSLVMIASADAGAESTMTSTSSTLMVAVNFFIVESSLRTWQPYWCLSIFTISITISIMKIKENKGFFCGKYCLILWCASQTM